MFCSKCGKEINDTTKFCQNCGNQINISNNSAYKITDVNPNKTEEIKLKIINCILMPIYAVLGIVVFAALVSPIFALIISAFTLFFVSPTEIIESWQSEINSMIYISIIILIIIGICNYIFLKKTKEKMLKNNYQTIVKTNYLINKKKYLLLSFFFGVFGVHRFAAGDKKGGFKYLYVWIVMVILTIIFSEKSYSIIIGITAFLIFENIALALTDHFIAKTKTVDENGNIYV